MNDDQCDYCGDPLWGTFLMRAVGFASLEPDGPQAPQVKTWCGECETPDDIDPEAHAAFRRAIAPQAEATS